MRWDRPNRWPWQHSKPQSSFPFRIGENGEKKSNKKKQKPFASFFVGTFSAWKSRLMRHAWRARTNTNPWKTTRPAHHLAFASLNLCWRNEKRGKIGFCLIERGTYTLSSLDHWPPLDYRPVACFRLGGRERKKTPQATTPYGCSKQSHTWCVQSTKV